jgi:hypothetical protein
MGLEILNPVHPKNPASVASEKNPTPAKENKDTFHEGAEYVYLPSKGVFYTGEFNGLDKLKVRRLDWTDEDILTTPSFWEDGSVFLELLKNCIVDENGFKAESLVPVDRDTILLWLRSTSLGNNFEISYYCPVCNKGGGSKTKDEPGKMVWKINELEIPVYETLTYEELKNHGEITLTLINNKDIKVKISTPSLGKTLKLEKDFQKKTEKGESNKKKYSSSTLLAVTNGVEVDGKVIRNKTEIEAYFKSLPLSILDSRYIIKVASELNIKYNTAQTFKCKDCGHTEEGVELPILHKNFFWPEL